MTSAEPFAGPGQPLASQRILAVHAHPDDEVTGNGGTFAAYADRGAHITLVTCTLGEEGEVLVPELEQLGAAHADQLGGYRIWELRGACEALGVSEQHFLGGPGRYRDSGMMGEPANDNPRSFWRADLDAAAAYLVPIIRRNRPHVLLTYNEFGGYGHPDHIQAHRVAVRATELAADPSYQADAGEPWEIPKTYYGAFPRSVLARGVELMKEQGIESPFGEVDVETAPFVTDDELVTTAIAGDGYTAQVRRAMEAHRTQISMEHPFYRFVESLGPETQRDFYQLARGELGTRDPESGYETDLFAGIEIDRAG